MKTFMSLGILSILLMGCSATQTPSAPAVDSGSVEINQELKTTESEETQETEPDPIDDTTDLFGEETEISM